VKQRFSGWRQYAANKEDREAVKLTDMVSLINGAGMPENP